MSDAASDQVPEPGHNLAPGPVGGKGPPRASFLTHGGEIGAAVCGRMRLAGYGRCGKGGQAGLRRHVGQQHVTTPSPPSEDVGEEYHERDQNHGADHDDQPIGAHLRIYGLGSGRGGGRRGYPRAALRWASSIRCRRWQSPRPRRSADILRAIPAAPSATHRVTDRPGQRVESMPRIAPRRSTMVTSRTDDGPYAVARRTRHGCQRPRPATGVSRLCRNDSLCRRSIAFPNNRPDEPESGSPSLFVKCLGNN